MVIGTNNIIIHAYNIESEILLLTFATSVLMSEVVDVVAKMATRLENKEDGE